ncbi:hypothetical protein AB1286_03305 [Trinickia sp. NRRL B-1857]|uniref:hypothetical protein n=1 Tax=Trinickia sp. NRRL B-1857 TaxID=3162879 RepID=UPI003D2D3637
MMQDNDPLIPPLAPDGGDAFPPFHRRGIDEQDIRDEFSDTGTLWPDLTGNMCQVDLSNDLLEKLRAAAEAAEVQQQHDVPLSPRADPAQAPAPNDAPQDPAPSGAPQGPAPNDAPQGPAPSGAPQGPAPSGAPQGPAPSGPPHAPNGVPHGPAPNGPPHGPGPNGQPHPAPQPPHGAPKHDPKRKNKNSNNDHDALIARLNKKPHVIEFKGAELDHNERLKIIAAVAMCESGSDPFAAENKDQEFVGRHGTHKGIETSYSRIVHIGLSYGVIQFTQDGGPLGGVLTKCNQKNHQKFVETFGDNWQELLTLTTTGIDVPGVNYASGLEHWHAISGTKDGKAIAKDAAKDSLPVGSEIRGKRVQPIAITVGGAKQDLWEGTWAQRFKDAGKVTDFQEAQLEYAVDQYLNPTLSFCKTNNIRSGLALAFAVACRVRGVNPQLLVEAAKNKKLKVPFESEADERAAVESISKNEVKSYQTTVKGKAKTVKVAKEESVRAGRLMKDETGFLAEDMYWTDSYESSYDK